MESRVLKWEMFKLMCLALYLVCVCGTVRDVQESTQEKDLKSQRLCIGSPSYSTGYSAATQLINHLPLF